MFWVLPLGSSFIVRLIPNPIIQEKCVPRAMRGRYEIRRYVTLVKNARRSSEAQGAYIFIAHTLSLYHIPAAQLIVRHGYHIPKSGDPRRRRRTRQRRPRITNQRNRRRCLRKRQHLDRNRQVSGKLLNPDPCGHIRQANLDAVVLLVDRQALDPWNAEYLRTDARTVPCQLEERVFEDAMHRVQSECVTCRRGTAKLGTHRRQDGLANSGYVADIRRCGCDHQTVGARLEEHAGERGVLPGQGEHVGIFAEIVVRWMLAVRRTRGVRARCPWVDVGLSAPRDQEEE